MDLVSKRQAEPSLDDSVYKRIEIVFGIPVYLTQDQQTRLNELIKEICEREANQPQDGAHFISCQGAAKPIFDETPQQGEVGTSIALKGWDESTLYFESTAKVI